MGDTVFRTKVIESEKIIPKAPEDKSIGPIESKVEVPFTDYEQVNTEPYSVTYFNLGSLWDDPEGGFNEEIQTIETYFKDKINKGEMANSITAVKNGLKELEKMNNHKHEERITVKLGTLAAYIKFLMDTDKVKYNARKYGTRY